MATIVKSSSKPHGGNSAVAMLLKRQRALESQLGQVERKLSKLGRKKGKITPPVVLDRLLDQLAARSKGGPGLPVDFSREDLYDDHD